MSHDIKMPAKTARTDTDVLISGGGPVGLCLALLLAEQQIDVTVIEQEAAIVRDLRASTFHPPTLDMLEQLGVTPRLIAQGLPCPSWQIRLHPGGERAVFDLSVLKDDTRHPYRLQCEQWKLSEALLGRRVIATSASRSRSRPAARAKRCAPATWSGATARAARFARAWTCRSRA